MGRMRTRMPILKTPTYRSPVQFVFSLRRRGFCRFPAFTLIPRPQVIVDLAPFTSIIEKCPLAALRSQPNPLVEFFGAARLQLSVVAETALAAMPEYPDDSKAWKPTRGRRLLGILRQPRGSCKTRPSTSRANTSYRCSERLWLSDLLKTLILREPRREEKAFIKQQIKGFQDMLVAAPPALRLPLQAQLDILQEHLVHMSEGGGSVNSWVSVLKDSEIVKETLPCFRGEKLGPWQPECPRRVVPEWSGEPRLVVSTPRSGICPEGRGRIHPWKRFVW